MTTIAYKEGILAADTQVTFDNIRSFGRKIHLLNSGAVLAFSGHVDDERKLIDYYNGVSKKRPTARKKYEFFYLDETGIPYYSINDSGLVLLEDRFYALGSGWQIAVSAMHIGMSAMDAIKIAGELNIQTNQFVDVYNCKTRKLTKAVWPHEKKLKK